MGESKKEGRREEMSICKTRADNFATEGGGEGDEGIEWERVEE